MKEFVNIHGAEEIDLFYRGRQWHRTISRSRVLLVTLEENRN